MLIFIVKEREKNFNILAIISILKVNYVSYFASI